MLKLRKLAVCVFCTLYLYMKLNIIKDLPLKACRFLLANCLDFWARVYSSEFWAPPPPISLNRIEAKEVTIKGVLDKTKWSLKWAHETLWHLSLGLLYSFNRQGLLASCINFSNKRHRGYITNLTTIVVTLIKSLLRFQNQILTIKYNRRGR